MALPRLPGKSTPLQWRTGVADEIFYVRATACATLAALFTVLSWHARPRIDEAAHQSWATHSSCYAAVLSALESAAEQSSDGRLAESTKYCRKIYSLCESDRWSGGSLVP